MPYISKIKLPGSNSVYEIVDRKGRAMIAGDFNSATSYAIGDYVIYNDKLYEFTAAHSGAWDAEDVVETTTTDEIKQIKNTISGGVHYIGVTTTKLYDGCTTNPVTINGALVTALRGDLVIFTLQTGIQPNCTAVGNYPMTVTTNTYYYLSSTISISERSTKFWFSGPHSGTVADFTAFTELVDFVGEVRDGGTGTVYLRLEFIWDGDRWNAFGGPSAFGELAYKDKVSGTYTKPTGSGSVTVNDYSASDSKLVTTSITGVAGTTSASKMTAGTAVAVATVGTAVRYGTADVGAAVTYGTANKASSATTVGNANVGSAVAVATQGNTFYYGTADVDTAVTVATAGTPVVYGNADVGASVTYGNANVGTTTQNVAIASGATAPYAVDGVTVSMDTEDTEMLIIATATTGVMTQVTSTTSIVQAASSNTTLTPAKAADTTRKLTPVGGTTSITPAKSAGTTHSAVGVGGTTNITPAVTSTTTIYGAVDSTSTLTPAVAAPNTQTLIPAVSNGTITPWTETAITVATAAASPTTVATGSLSGTGSGGTVVTTVTSSASSKSVTVGTTTDTLVSR